jgi:5'-3' exonuclease
MFGPPVTRQFASRASAASAGSREDARFQRYYRDGSEPIPKTHQDIKAIRNFRLSNSILTKIPLPESYERGLHLRFAAGKCYYPGVRLHLVDGTYELYRAHYAPRPDYREPSGMDAKATVGIVESLLALLHDPQEAVTHIAVAFDNPIHSFRNDLFPPYKSDEGVPPELRAQFDAAENAVSSIGVTVWSMHEYEADDGLASGARRFRDQVEQVRILTPDKDLGQCLCDDRVVQVDRRQKKVTSELAFRAERGFGPASMPDFLALTGDRADGIPGLAGFGKKRGTAAKRL